MLVEGWKTGAYPKLEIWRPVDRDRPPRFPTDPTIVAVASEFLLDPARHGRSDLSILSLADLNGIVEFIVQFIRKTEPVF